MVTTEKAGIKLDCRAYPIKEPKGKTVAYASVTINDIVAINGIQVIDGKNGLFAQMPQTKFGDNYKDIAFPVTKELRTQLNEAIIFTYIDARSKESVKDTIKDGQKAEKSAPVKTAPVTNKNKDSKKSEPVQ